MTLATRLATTGADGVFTRTEQARQCCRLAKQLESAGEYEAAREALGEFWPDGAEKPIGEELDRSATAEVLLRAGTLIGWLGGADQSQRQDEAKDLITKSIEIFRELGESDRVAEAQSDLAVCYWREGAFNEARDILRGVIRELGDDKNDIKATALIRRAIVEKAAARYSEALRFYKEAEPLVATTSDHGIKGCFHMCLANLLSSIGIAENRSDYIDQSLMDFTAASVHFEHAGLMRNCGGVENNLGFLYQNVGRFPEAYEHINRARDIFLSLGDLGHAAQVNDTRARALLAEGRHQEAERYARAAVKTLGRGDECSLLVEALTTHGTALARLGRFDNARSQLNRAIEAGENCGDLEGAARAKLSIIEELAGQTAFTELASIYRSALEILAKSQDPAATPRLIAAAKTVIGTFLAEQPPGTDPEAVGWEGFSLKKELRAFEKALLERALRTAGGSVTTASRLLGFRHHQSLISLLNTRHRELLKNRSAVRKRRQPIFAKPGHAGKKSTSKARSAAGRISVLHIEDNKEVAQVINDYLTASGMEVDACANGMTALRILTGDTPYNVIIVDHDLPGLSGLELVRRVSKITHRRNTPIIMLSGDDIETEAWRAGVTDFLRKPQDIDRVASTVSRLIRIKNKSD